MVPKFDRQQSYYERHSVIFMAIGHYMLNKALGCLSLFSNWVVK